ncbi:hypothetical protein BDR06DRAFT_976071 [Suillus hirtellus]|nr:hypothetical protein BDR06DRAFT_976071 [Suillus hirtellus]
MEKDDAGGALSLASALSMLSSAAAPPHSSSSVTPVQVVEVCSSLTEPPSTSNMPGTPSVMEETVSEWVLFLPNADGFSRSLSQWLLTLHSVKILLFVFPKQQDVYDWNESDDLLLQPSRSVGQHILRYLKAIVAWYTAVGTLCSPENSQFTCGKLTLGLLDIPHCGFEITTLDDIYKEYFKRYESDLEAHKAVLRQEELSRQEES